LKDELSKKTDQNVAEARADIDAKRVIEEAYWPESPSSEPKAATQDNSAQAEEDSVEDKP